MATDYQLIEITPEDFEKLPDNPIQRDSQSHGLKFNAGWPNGRGHLAKPHISHIKVVIGKIRKTGKMVKVDGHTRSWLFSRGLLDLPEGYTKFIADVWTVDTMDDIILLYQCCDGYSGSKEQSMDKIFGCFRALKFHPQHTRIWKHTGLISSCRALQFARRSQRTIVSWPDSLEPFIETMKLIDSYGEFIRHERFPTPVMTAMLATVRRYGKPAGDWWLKYHSVIMRRNPKSIDAVYKANDLLEELHNPMLGNGGRTRSDRIGTYAPRFIHCCEQGMDKVNFPLITSSKQWRTYWSEVPDLKTWWEENFDGFDFPELVAQQELPIDEVD